MRVIPDSFPGTPSTHGAAGMHVGRSRRSLAIAAIVGIPASAAFLFFAIRGADPGAVWAALAGVRLAPLLGTVACMGLVYWLQALRWRKIALTGLGQRRFFEMVVAGVAVNNVLPARAGDLLRARWVSRGAYGYGRGVATVILDRGFDLVVLAAMLLGTLSLVTDAGWVDRVVVGALVALALLGLGIVVAREYTKRHPYSRLRARGMLRGFARDTLDGLSEPFGSTRTTELVAISVAAWLVWSVGALLAARSVGVELTVLQAVFVTGAINLGVAIPSSPGFVGTYQWLGVSALALFGIGQESALAFAIVLQAAWWVPTTLAGFALLLTGESRGWRGSVAPAPPSGARLVPRSG